MKTIFPLFMMLSLLCIACDNSADIKARVLADLHSDGSVKVTSAKSLPAMDWIEIADPRENAFRIEVPKGWNNRIGLERVNGQTCSRGESISPDGNTRLFFGDPRVMRFYKPNPTLQMMGDNFNPNDPFRAVQNFPNPHKFFSNYVVSTYGRTPKFRILKVEDDASTQRNYSEKMNQATQGQIQLVVYAVTVTFEFEQNNESIRGCLHGIAIDGPMMWSAEVNGFTAPVAMFDATNDMLAHMINSYRINPQWRENENQAFASHMATQQQQSNARLNQLSQEHNQRMSNMQNNWNAHQQHMNGLQQSYDNQMNTWQNQQNSWDNQHHRTIDAIREEQLVRGSNGQYGKVESGYDQYYVNPNNQQYFGTNSQLQSVPENYEQWEKADYGDDW